MASSTPVALLSKPYNTTKKMKTETVPCGVKLESTHEPAPQEPSESEGRTCKSCRSRARGCGGSSELGDDLGLFHHLHTSEEESEVVEGTHKEPAHSTNHIEPEEEGGMWRHGITTKGTTADQTKKQHEPKI